MEEQYELERKDLLYYKKSLELIERIKKDNNSKSIIDIGGWAGGFIKQTSLDIKHCLDKESKEEINPGVDIIISDFLDWDIQRYDIACCMQVLEHLSDKDVSLFAQKLFKVSDHVVISVPFMWHEKFCKYHKQDPVGFSKLKKWTLKKPTEHYLVREKDNVLRLIAYYKKEQQGNS